MKKYILVFFVLVASGFFIANFLSKNPISKIINYEVVKEEWVVVDRVIDGDTFVTNSGEKIRIIGIDAPEYHKNQKIWYIQYLGDILHTKRINISCLNKMGEESYTFLRGLIEGKKVKLEVIKYDKYGRLLSYVYICKDGNNCTDIAYYLLINGYAIIYPYENFKKKELYYQWMKQAIEKQRGVFSCVV